MNSNFFFLGIIAFAFSGLISCQKNPPKIVEEIYSASNKGEYSKIVPFLLPDSISPFTESEANQFNTLMKGVMPGVPNYVSYSVECSEPTDNDSIIRFKVNTAFADGTSYIEEGMLKKTIKGHWKLIVDTPLGDTTVYYKIKDATKKSPELMRNLDMPMIWSWPQEAFQTIKLRRLTIMKTAFFKLQI